MKRLADGQQMAPVEAVSNGRSSPLTPETHWPVLDARLRQGAAFRRGELGDLRHRAPTPITRMLTISIGLSAKKWPYSRSCASWKAAPDLVELLLSKGAGGNVNLELVALADVAQIAVADERHAVGFEMIGGKLLPQVRFHGGDIGVEPVEIDTAADLELGADGVVFEIGGRAGPWPR